VRQGKGKRDRFIPLSATTVTVVGDYLAVRGTAQSDHLLLFRQQKVKPGLVQARLQRYGRAIGVQVSPHRLRHTLATRLMNIGTNIVSIQHLLGHEKLQTTQIYTHVYDATVEQDFRQAMARLEGERERRPAATQAEPMALVEGLSFHIREPVSVVNQALNCV
jgi:site-specific recombinase XerD